MAAPLTVRGTAIRHRFGDTVAVDGVDLAVPAGAVFGLLGPNGAGKITTIRMITTLLPAPIGAIEVFGVDVARHKLAVRRLIGYGLARSVGSLILLVVLYNFFTYLGVDATRCSNRPPRKERNRCRRSSRAQPDLRPPACAANGPARTRHATSGSRCRTPRWAC